MIKTLSCIVFMAAIAGYSMLSYAAKPKVRDDYELTVAVVKKALVGWELFQAKKFEASFNDGYYTDPDPYTQVRDFWSNGYYAKLDRDGNGHHETIFEISENELVYVGSLGSKGTFVDVSRDYDCYMGVKLSAALPFMNDCQSDGLNQPR